LLFFDLEDPQEDREEVLALSSFAHTASSEDDDDIPFSECLGADDSKEDEEEIWVVAAVVTLAAVVL